MKIPKLLFGTAGVPLCSKDRSTLAGIPVVKKLGLDAMEIEFVRGVKMTNNLAEEVGRKAAEEEVVLTCHDPYYINLASDDAKTKGMSKSHILESARKTSLAGGYSVVFHAAYYQKRTPEETYLRTKDQLGKVIQTLKDENIKVWIRPETTGKPSQLGTVEETIRLSQELDQVLPCVDFAHLHARSNGKMNTLAEFRKVLEQLEKELGRESLKNMHIHLSGINYGEKGEKNHLFLKDSDMNYKDLLAALREFDCKGVVISESPNIEEDAILMKKEFYKKI